MHQNATTAKICISSFNFAQIKNLSGIFKDLGKIRRITYQTLVRSRKILKFLPLTDLRFLITDRQHIRPQNTEFQMTKSYSR
jgi:hypothetical protein